MQTRKCWPLFALVVVIAVILIFISNRGEDNWIRDCMAESRSEGECKALYDLKYPR